MIVDSYIVPARSWAEIASITQDLREGLGLGDEPHFPIVDVVERVFDQQAELLKLEIGDDDEMRGAEGYSDPNGEFLLIHERVYKAACRGDGRSRFTMAHEFGHFILHSNVRLARVPQSRKVEPYKLSEPQANQFAAELLMPAHFFRSEDLEPHVISRHGVSFEAARNRLAYLRKGRVI